MTFNPSSADECATTISCARSPVPSSPSFARSKRRRLDEMQYHELWQCSTPYCSQVYKRTSTVSIQLHRAACPLKMAHSHALVAHTLPIAAAAITITDRIVSPSTIPNPVPTNTSPVTDLDSPSLIVKPLSFPAASLLPLLSFPRNTSAGSNTTSSSEMSSLPSLYSSHTGISSPSSSSCSSPRSSIHRIGSAVVTDDDDEQIETEQRKSNSGPLQPVARVLSPSSNFSPVACTTTAFRRVGRQPPISSLANHNESNTNNILVGTTIDNNNQTHLSTSLTIPCALTPSHVVEPQALSSSEPGTPSASSSAAASTLDHSILKPVILRVSSPRTDKCTAVTSDAAALTVPADNGILSSAVPSRPSSSSVASSPVSVEKVEEPKRKRRYVSEMNEDEKWQCSNYGCTQIYRKNSTLSIRKHKEMCAFQHRSATATVLACDAFAMTMPHPMHSSSLDVPNSSIFIMSCVCGQQFTFPNALNEHRARCMIYQQSSIQLFQHIPQPTPTFTLQSSMSPAAPPSSMSSTAPLCAGVQPLLSGFSPYNSLASSPSLFSAFPSMSCASVY